MKICSKSDVGLIRDTNQDACYFKILSETSAWAVVCDGMGGANAGGTASFLTVETIKKEMENFDYINMDEVAVKNFLLAAASKANRIVFEKASKEESLKGMGTTMILLTLLHEVIHIVHAGDSRAYLINKKKIRQLTTDHSIVQDMINRGEITQDQAKDHPHKNIITRALGVDTNLEFDYVKVFAKKEAFLLVCTDGLTNQVDEQKILETFVKSSHSDEFAENLIELAKSSGGNDNITVLLISN
ncbi:MAG: Stp1/IreP family PP2C-type Ser/Thr phosphatase [Oscillospiraceae bacterium]|nr:Stp1/IreP family PP2C-type Ser/Thr phosphatase [Oscillospiraceae bacterium]